MHTYLSEHSLGDVHNFFGEKIEGVSFLIFLVLVFWPFWW